MFYNENKFYSTNVYIVSHSCDCFLYSGCKWFQTSKEDIYSKNKLLFCCKLQVQWEIMNLKKKYWIKSFFHSFSSGLQRSTTAGCHLTWRFFSSSADVWPHRGAALVTRKGQSFSFSDGVIFCLAQCCSVWVDTVPREAQLGCALLRGLTPCCAVTQHHRNSQTNETWGDFNISRRLSESFRVYTVVTVLYLNYFSVISMQSLAFLVNIWFSTKEAKAAPDTRKYFQWGLKILPWKFTRSNTVCFSGTFQWLWS